MESQSCKGFDRKKAIFMIWCTSQRGWGNQYFLDTGYHDKIISIHEIKTGSYQ